MPITPKQEKLAVDIASALGDMKSITWHRQMVQLYAEEHLRDCMLQALKVKEENVINSRGAIYNKLVREGYVRNSRN